MGHAYAMAWASWLYTKSVYIPKSLEAWFQVIQLSFERPIYRFGYIISKIWSS